MGTIVKSVKNMIISYLKENGTSTLKNIVSSVLLERPEVKTSQIRGVLNDDVRKGGIYFIRDCRGVYGLKKGHKKDISLENPVAETFSIS